MGMFNFGKNGAEKGGIKSEQLGQKRIGDALMLGHLRFLMQCYCHVYNVGKVTLKRLLLVC